MQVSQQHAKPRADAEETYRGVSAPKRKRVEETPAEIGEMPKVRSSLDFICHARTERRVDIWITVPAIAVHSDAHQSFPKILCA